MSLRSRVALLILVLFLAGMLVVLARTLQHAQKEIGQHIDSSQLRDLTQRDSQGASSQQSANPADDVPRWFVTLMGGDDFTLVQATNTINGEMVLVRVDPHTQIAAIWTDTKADLISRLGSLLMLNILIYLMLGQWLRPIDSIVEGLREIELGDFGKRIPLSGVGELDQITNNINHLTTTLGASKADNERLQSASISRAEQERLRLARELHDSLGQSISAIKAVSASINMRARAQMPDIADSAQQIEKISDTAYKSVKNLMSSLRPSVLDELGLGVALQQMVDDWNLHHESTFCRLRIDCKLDDLDGEQTINIFRIVQEALNNIAKYAHASEAKVLLSGHEVLTLEIVDNGVGFDPETVKKGMGLWNIQDRVNLLLGKFELQASPGNGLRLFMEFPRELSQRSAYRLAQAAVQGSAQ